MEPDSTARFWRRGWMFIKNKLHGHLKALRKLTLQELWRSKTVKLFVVALLFSELIGLLAALLFLHFMSQSLSGGILAIGSATTVSYYTVTATFYGISWPIVRLSSGHKKLARILLGDITMFAGIGVVLDRLMWWTENLLGAIFLWIYCSETTAILLATSIQILLYIPLATLACAPALIRKGNA